MNHAPTQPTTTETATMNHTPTTTTTESTTMSIEKIANLPAVKAAIAEAAAAEESASLTARMAVLDAHQQAIDELTALDAQRDELDAQQDELDQQRDILAQQRTALEMERQQVEAQRRDHARHLRDTHGGRLVADTARMLGGHAEAFRREAEYQRNLCERKPDRMGYPVSRPSPEAKEKAAALERRAERFEQARDAIVALQFARIPPQQIERTITAAMQKLGFTLHVAEQAEGWRVEGWDGKLPTKQAA